MKMTSLAGPSIPFFKKGVVFDVNIGSNTLVGLKDTTVHQVNLH